MLMKRSSQVIYAYVSEKLKEDAKVKAIRQGVSLSYVVERLLQKWLDDEIDIRPEGEQQENG